MKHGIAGMLMSLWGLLSAAVLVAQQSTCPALVQAAYATTALECAEVAPGEACYGHPPLTVEAEDAGLFTRPGQRISGVQQLESGPMALDSGVWGVALLNVQGNLPGQAVVMIVLGEVTLENASPAAAPVTLVPAQVSFAGGTNLRAAPSEEAEIIAPLVTGQRLSVTGRLADGSWLHVWLADERQGWVRADLVTLAGEADWLPEVTPADDLPATRFGPMQAFTFTSAADEAPCSAAPQSGILLQTSDLTRVVANGVMVEFDGTVFLQAPRELVVHVLEGTARADSGGSSETAVIGQQIRVRYDTAAQELTTPRPPEPAAWVRMLPLPLGLLPRDVGDLPFNLVGIATPAVPDGPLLEGITAESACTVGAVNEVRLRQGPGTAYPIRGALYAGESARPDARAAGQDGLLWWQLSEGVWVRSDVVLAAGTCGALPLVEPPPLPTATPADES